MCSVNPTDHRVQFCLNLHYNGANSYLFVNGTKIIKFKAKDSNIAANPLCLGSTSKDWSVDNMKDIGLNGYVLALIMMLLWLMILNLFTSIWWRKME